MSGSSSPPLVGLPPPTDHSPPPSPPIPPSRRPRGLPPLHSEPEPPLTQAEITTIKQKGIAARRRATGRGRENKET